MQKQISIAGKELLLVQFPKGTEYFKFETVKTEETNVRYLDKDLDFEEISIPEGEWKPLCNPFEPTEEFLEQILSHKAKDRRESIWIDVLTSNDIYLKNQAPFPMHHDRITVEEWEEENKIFQEGTQKVFDNAMMFIKM